MHPTATPGLPRTSQLVWWPFAGLLVLVVAAEGAGGGEVWGQAAGNVWYLAWGVWAVWLCRRHGIGIRRLVGRPRGRGA